MSLRLDAWAEFLINFGWVYLIVVAVILGYKTAGFLFSEFKERFHRFVDENRDRYWIVGEYATDHVHVCVDGNPSDEDLTADMIRAIGCLTRRIADRYYHGPKAWKALRDLYADPEFREVFQEISAGQFGRDAQTDREGSRGRGPSADGRAHDDSGD